MAEDEIYVTCICGAVINERIMYQHVQDCLTEDFIQKAVSLKISHPCEALEHPPHKESQVCVKCLRCGYPIVKNEGTMITLYPSVKRSSFTRFCNDRNKVAHRKDQVCKTCNLPDGFHENGPEMEEEVTDDCTDGTLEGEKHIQISSSSVLFKGGKLREKQPVLSHFLESVSEEEEDDDDDDFETASDNEISGTDFLNHEIPVGTYCRLFHLALIPSDNVNNSVEDSSHQSYSLLLQILDPVPHTTTVSMQTDLPLRADAEVQVKILGVYPKEVEELFAGKQEYKVPEYDPAVEAAFESHLESLIACEHCSRRFSPDRIQYHTSCCIERPKSRTRDCATPKDGEIPR